MKSGYANKAVVIHVFDHRVTCEPHVGGLDRTVDPRKHTHPPALRLQAVSELNHKFLIHTCVSGGHGHRNAGSALFLLF